MDAVAHIRLHTSEACQAAVEVVRTLRAAGHSAYLVGGCVRDLVLGLDPKDYDVATSASPGETCALFRHVVEVGVAFGVVRVRLPALHGGEFIETEVATYRAEVGHSDGRRPDTVRFTDAREDVLRRDFTLNGLLLDPLTPDGQPAEQCLVVDWVAGLADLQARVLRAIGDPVRRFEEDALRLVRAARFASRFGLAVEPLTAQAIRAAAPSLLRVSAERIAGELGLMLTGCDAVLALTLLDDLGLAATLWPELCTADPQLAACRARFHALLRELPGAVAQPHPYALEPETRVRLPLAVATLWWPLRDRLSPDDLARQWRLSNADGGHLRDIWGLARALQPWAPAGKAPGPPLVRLLRQPDADAALLLLLAATREPARLQGLRSLRLLRAGSTRDNWWPKPMITGDRLLELGHAPGPRFRAALTAAEDTQLRGGTYEAAFAAALAALEQEQPDKLS